MPKKPPVPHPRPGSAPANRRHSTPDAGLGRPVFLHGEDEAAYDRLLAQTTDAVRPTDIIEEFWVRDVVDLVWEVLRLRRLKAQLLVSSAGKGLEEVLRPLVSFIDLHHLVEGWCAREAAALKKVDALLKQAGLTMQAVMAQTLAAKLDQIDRIDRMIASAEARRHLVLREVDRRRAAVAARLRAASEQIEDADFVDVAVEPTPDRLAG